MTSDHRVAGSSPAGCKSSLIADLKAILDLKKSPKNELLAKVLPFLKRTPSLLRKRFKALLESLPQVFRTKWDSLDIKELGISSESQEGIIIRSPHLLGFWKTVAVAHLRRQQRENP
jgi:hypothetical protein